MNEGEGGRTTTGAAIVEFDPAMKRHWELEIRTLQEAPRDAEKLRKLLEAKRKEYEEAEDYETRCRLVTEIEMLRFVLCVQ
ncbi:MAG: hypothetical protein M3270_07415 [Thermoproteota archaeon]|nr:hypothetical protein [Thermoproteota archaeon]